MMGGLPPFTEADFVLSKEKRAEITAGLTPAQAKMVEHWMDLHEVINRGDWDGMDKFFNTDTMTYDNPNRPDLGTYHVWKTSPQGLYKTFPPSIYRTLKAWGRGEDEIRSEEHTSELQSLMRISYAVFCLKKKKH